MTPESGGSATISVTASPDLGVAPQEPTSLAERQHSKKKSPLSAGTLASLLTVNQDGDRKRARKVRKRTEKVVRHEQTLQELRTADRRRAYFRDAAHRRELVFGPEVRYASPCFRYNRDDARFVLFWQDVFTTDFCYGFIQFAPTLSLHLPGGISFDLMHYWDGQPVRFMCCERKREAEGGGGEGGAGDVPWGRVLWCVAIEHEDGEQSQPVPKSQPQPQTVGENGGPQDKLANDID